MKRFRQYRINQEIRNRYAEVSLHADNFIYPYFVVQGTSIKKEIPNLKNVFHFSTDMLVDDIKECMENGVKKFLLFGIIDKKEKNPEAQAAYTKNNIISVAVEKIKSKVPNAILFTDVCLCAYTNHGHCGLVNDNEIDNDATLPLLARIALTHALAGSDFVAPSAMMDGQVDAIKKILVENHVNTKILSYSAKYASGFYGPFRDAVSSTPCFGDRKSYQMDYRTITQGIDEVKADIEEGADWVMVKPAHTYLDIIQRVKLNFPNVPLAAYQVSGEYMMIEAAAHAGYVNKETAIHEVFTAIKRAGADYIISYYAKDFVRKSLQRSL